MPPKTKTPKTVFILMREQLSFFGGKDSTPKKMAFVPSGKRLHSEGELENHHFQWVNPL